MSFAELLLVEVVLGLPDAVALLDFLHETHVVLAECLDDRVQTALAFAQGHLFVSGGQSGEGAAVLLGHSTWKLWESGGIK
jgi:hypothetical protein